MMSRHISGWAAPGPADTAILFVEASVFLAGCRSRERSFAFVSACRSVENALCWEGKRVWRDAASHTVILLTGCAWCKEQVSPRHPNPINKLKTTTPC